MIYRGQVIIKSILLKANALIGFNYSYTSFFTCCPLGS